MRDAADRLCTLDQLRHLTSIHAAKPAELKAALLATLSAALAPAPAAAFSHLLAEAQAQQAARTAA